PSPGSATAQEAADAGAHASGEVTCAAHFPGRQDLLAASVGVYLYTAGPCGPGGHAVLAVWVYQSAGGWHPYTWASTQVGNLPTDTWGQHIPMDTGGGCVNARAAPSTSAAVVSCVGASVTVVPASSTHEPWHPPVWADGYIWWYVFRLTAGTGPDTQGSPLGWVTLDFLVCGSGPRSLNQACGH
ncbi:MAG: hypothetical protein J2P38_09910, partial [Candidatus Dormibacteraeota bacterium]|nr:hypothetical protein [Candidatus Dormibacteraeota bacterium]